MAFSDDVACVSELLPSVVRYGAGGEVECGVRALRSAVTDPGNTFLSFKRLMGVRYSDLEASGSPLSFPFELVEGNDGFVEMQCSARGSPVRPVEASAVVLKTLVARAEAFTGDRIDRAVVTVPARFGTEAIDATREAAAEAGIERVVILQEPVAAALAHGVDDMDKVAEQLVLVFDLGGGTCDVSLLECFDGVVEVVATAGDPFLGGNDMDQALARLILRRAGIGEPEDPVQLCRLREAAERAKIELSTAASTHVLVPFLQGCEGLDVEITREEFDEEIGDIMDRIAVPLRSLGDEARLTWDWKPWDPDAQAAAAKVDKWAPPPRKVTQLVFVGGASRVPCVRALVQKMVGLDAGGVDPETAVALGAAVHGGVLEGDISALEVMDGSYNWMLHQRVTGM
ncbi:unnamed protein product [Pedinophyceae sp. YPF-701]|nr:unnamed protein product [Pedinophyceae sp. YPF-701]